MQSSISFNFGFNPFSTLSFITSFIVDIIPVNCCCSRIPCVSSMLFWIFFFILWCSKILWSVCVSSFVHILQIDFLHVIQYNSSNLPCEGHFTKLSLVAGFPCLSFSALYCNISKISSSVLVIIPFFAHEHFIVIVSHSFPKVSISFKNKFL